MLGHFLFRDCYIQLILTVQESPKWPSIILMKFLMFFFFIFVLAGCHPSVTMDDCVALYDPGLVYLTYFIWVVAHPSVHGPGVSAWRWRIAHVPGRRLRRIIAEIGWNCWFWWWRWWLRLDLGHGHWSWGVSCLMVPWIEEISDHLLDTLDVLLSYWSAFAQVFVD